MPLFWEEQISHPLKMYQPGAVVIATDQVQIVNEYQYHQGNSTSKIDSKDPYISIVGIRVSS